MSREWPEPVFGDEHEARAARQRQEEERREALRLEVRRRFPSAVSKAAEVQAVFGEGVRIVWAIEDGWAVGRVPPEEIERHEIQFGPLRWLRLGD